MRFCRPVGVECDVGRHAEVFGEVTPGSGIGIVPQADAAQRRGTMLVLERTEADGMAAALRPYTGYHQCGVDLLFVAEDRGLQRDLRRDRRATARRNEGGAAPRRSLHVRDQTP